MVLNNKDGYMGNVTVGEKGQIVIPKLVRDMCDIKPGDSIILLASSKRGIAIPRKQDSEKIINKIMRELDEKETEK